MKKALIAGLAMVSGLASFAVATKELSAGETVKSVSSVNPTPGLAAASQGAESIPSTIDSAPDALLSAATTVVTAALKQERSAETRNPARLTELLQSTILPLFDFRHMTQLAVARNWRLASTEQQGALVTEFRSLLLRTYMSSLATYRDQRIDYKPLRTTAGETEVTVKSTVRQSGSEPMSIDYDMAKSALGWKVFDIKIAGISLITNYRSTFAQIIADSGVDGLIKALATKNFQAENGPRAEDNNARPFLFMFTVIPSVIRGSK